MSFHRWHWAWLVLLIACSRSNEPVPNKNTNWLNVCVTAEDCGAGQTCLCGLCTTVCDATSECDRGGVPASCVPVSDRRIDAQCAANDDGDAVSICVAACDDTATCGEVGDGLACNEAVCVQTVFAAREAGPEAGRGAMDAEVPDAAPRDAASVTEVPDGQVADAMLDAASPADADVDAAADGGGAGGCPCQEGWSCIEGICAQILAEGQLGLEAFVRDAERLYWVNTGSVDQGGAHRHDGSIVAMPIGGGDLVTLAGGIWGPTGLAIDESYAYWIESRAAGEDFEAVIMRVALDGGTPERIVTSLNMAGIAVDDAFVYFHDTRPTTTVPDRWLKRAPKDGSGEPEPLIPGSSFREDGVRDIQLLGDMLYWGGGSHDVFAAPKDGSGEVSVFAGADASFAVAPDAVYYTHLNDGWVELYVALDDELLTLAHVDDGDFNISDASGIALDTDYVYWTWTSRLSAGFLGGALMRSEKSPGETAVVWSSELLVRPLVVIDGDYLYLAVRGKYQSGEDMVLRIAKP